MPIDLVIDDRDGGNSTGCPTPKPMLSGATTGSNGMDLPNLDISSPSSHGDQVS